MVIDRDVYLRNFVIGVLCDHLERGISSANISAVADDITQCVIDADRKWQHENMCEQVLEMASLAEDLPK